jgi:hypothetical protein
LYVGRVSGQPSIKAISDGYLIMDSDTQFAAINHYVNQDVIVAFGGGDVGIGLTAPQGKLHIQDGAGYAMHRYVSPINSATPIVVIPNGTGDVTEIVYLQIVVTDGTNSTSSTGSRTPGGAVVDLTLGTNTFRMTVNADGSVDVRRQAGTGTISAMIYLQWI